MAKNEVDTQNKTESPEGESQEERLKRENLEKENQKKLDAEKLAAAKNQASGAAPTSGKGASSEDEEQKKKSIREQWDIKFDKGDFDIMSGKEEIGQLFKEFIKNLIELFNLLSQSSKKKESPSQTTPAQSAETKQEEAPEGEKTPAAEQPRTEPEVKAIQDADKNLQDSLEALDEAMPPKSGKPDLADKAAALAEPVREMARDPELIKADDPAVDTQLKALGEALQGVSDSVEQLPKPQQAQIESIQEPQVGKIIPAEELVTQKIQVEAEWSRDNKVIDDLNAAVARTQNATKNLLALVSDLPEAAKPAAKVEAVTMPKAQQATVMPAPKLQQAETTKITMPDKQQGKLVSDQTPEPNLLVTGKLNITTGYDRAKDEEKKKRAQERAQKEPTQSNVTSTNKP